MRNINTVTVRLCGYMVLFTLKNIKRKNPLQLFFNSYEKKNPSGFIKATQFYYIGIRKNTHTRTYK